MSLTSSLKPRSGVYKPLTIGSHVMVRSNSRALCNHRTPCRSEHTPKNLATGPVALWPYGCGVAFFGSGVATQFMWSLDSFKWSAFWALLWKLDPAGRSFFSFVICEIFLFWLVVEPTPLKNISHWEGWHPIYEMENKSHVWNHQPVMFIFCFIKSFQLEQ